MGSENKKRDMNGQTINKYIYTKHSFKCMVFWIFKSC